MKGIVLETNKNEAAVLYEDGTVSKIKNRHYEKGQVVNMNKKFKLIAKTGSIAAALAISAVTGFAYTAPATYVSLDVNPSIEYKLNSFDRVISVVAVNDDGEKIVNELDLKNDKIAKAVSKTIDKLKKEGYLTEDEYSGIVIAVSNKNEEKSDELAKDIEDEINKDEENDEEEIKDDEEIKDEEEVKDEEKDTDEEDKDEELDEDDEKDTDEEKDDIQIVVEAVGRERVEEARKLNVTPGKLNLVQKLIASTDEFDDINEEQLQELLELSVKEINKMTQAFRKGLDVEFTFENDDLEEDLDDDKEVDKTEKAVNTDVEEDKDKDKDKDDADDVAKEDDEDKANKNKVKEEKEKENNKSEKTNDKKDEIEKVNVNSNSNGNSNGNGNNKNKNKNN